MGNAYNSLSSKSPGETTRKADDSNLEKHTSPQATLEAPVTSSDSKGNSSQGQHEKQDTTSPKQPAKSRAAERPKSRRRIAFRLSNRSSSTKQPNASTSIQGEGVIRSAEEFERSASREAEMVTATSALKKEKRRRKEFKEKTDSSREKERVVVTALALSEAEQDGFSKQQKLAEELDLEAPSFERRATRPKSARLGRQRSATLGSLPKPKFSPDALFSVKLNKVKRPEEAVEDASTESARASKLHYTSSKKAAEILPYLFVSGDFVAKNKEILSEKKITHIINAAHAVCKDYFPQDFVYLTFNLIDSAKETWLLPFLLEAVDFIEKARQEDGVLFVHCHQGVSRSCTIAIAYLMWLKHLSFQAAFDMVKERHPICGPNANFISQLMEWEKTLNLEQHKEPQLFRIAPHSHRDRKLIIKACKDDKPAVESLDHRGVFLLFDPKPRRFYVWKGDDCNDSGSMLEAAERFSTLMRSYLPAYKDCVIMMTEKGSVEEQRFFGLLGAEASRNDVPIANNLYDIEYGEQANVPAKPRPQHKIPVDLKDSQRTSDALSVKLYLWLSDTNGWEEISSYDGDDLESKNLNVVVSSNAKSKHECFIWLGADLEDTISEESAVGIAKEFCASITAKSDDFGIRTEKEGEESAEFWTVFEAGF